MKRTIFYILLSIILIQQSSLFPIFGDVKNWTFLCLQQRSQLRLELVFWKEFRLGSFFLCWWSYIALLIPMFQSSEGFDNVFSFLYFLFCLITTTRYRLPGTVTYRDVKRFPEAVTLEVIHNNQNKRDEKRKNDQSIRRKERKKTKERRSWKMKNRTERTHFTFQFTRDWW